MAKFADQYWRQRITATAAMISLLTAGTLQGSILFDNISAYESTTPGAGVTYTATTPNSFMGDGYVLATGATDITGVDLFPVNQSGLNFTGLQLSVYVWGTVNRGAVNTSSPAFSNLLGSYAVNVPGNFKTGAYYPFEGAVPGTTPNYTFATPIQLNGINTIGLTFNFEGTTNGITYRNANNLTSLVSYGVPPTVGADVFNGYYRNANSETNGNFTSSLRSLPLTNQSLAVRIFGDTAVPDQWITNSGGDWGVASNWSGAAVPTSMTDAVFNLSSSNYTVNVSAAGCKDLYVVSDDVTLDLQTASAPLSVGGVLAIGQPTSGTASTLGRLNLENSLGSSQANVSTGSVTLGGDGGAGLLTIGNQVCLTSSSTVSIASGSSIAIAPGGHLQSQSITIAGSSNAWTGLLDIGDGTLDLPAADLAIVTNQIKQGLGLSGGWNGASGITSTIAASDPTHLTAVGVMVNNNGAGVPLYGAGGAMGSFGGGMPGINDVLVRYTYFGDANLDGKVDGSDYSLIDNGYLNHLSGWVNGDFNYDGTIDGSDYTLIDNAFNAQGEAFPTAISVFPSNGLLVAIVGGSVPEPVFAPAVLAGIIVLLRRRYTL